MQFTSKAGKAASGFLLTVALSSLPALVQAQGLGEITLDSSLNEPLQAHIELLDVADLDATQIAVSLGSPQEFAAAGLERSLLLASLQFKVEKQPDESARIIITSTSDIAEPYLNFLVSFAWPNGRALREYTLLLDLPAANSGAPSPNNPVVTLPSAATTSTAPANRNETTPAPAAAAADASEYVVKAGDTAYQIAEQTRPSTDVSVQQMMLAIQRANEDAFVNNNINRILTGKVLRIPTANEISLIDQAAAVAQVNQQNQELTSQPLAVNDTTGNAPATARDELTLLNGNQAGGTGGSNDLSASIKALENELMLSEEGVDRARLENLELTNRLAALQEQIDLLQNIIAIEDERIAQLQADLGKQSTATQEALASVEAAANGEGGLVGMLKNSVILLGGLLAVALAAAAALFVRRRNAEALVHETNVELVGIDAVEDEKAGGLAAMLSSLMARFRRNSANDEEEHVEPELAPVAAEALPAEPKPAAPAPATNDLLDEMGFGDEFKNLQDVLDEVEESPADVAEEVEAVTEKADETAVAEAAAAMEEVALLDQALNEAESEQLEEDFLQASPVTESAPSAPESFAFSTEPVAEPEPEEDVAQADEKPDVFEFTLPNIDDTDTASAEPAAEEKLETFSFSSVADDSPQSPRAAAIDEVEDALEVLSFDEDSVTLDDAGEETASYDTGDAQAVHDARLDLAVAYEAMGDLDGAIEILDEVIATRKAPLVAEAERLKAKWQNG